MEVPWVLDHRSLDEGKERLEAWMREKREKARIWEERLEAWMREEREKASMLEDQEEEAMVEEWDSSIFQSCMDIISVPFSCFPSKLEELDVLPRRPLLPALLKLPRPTDYDIGNNLSARTMLRDAISHVDTLLKEVNKNSNGSYSSKNPLKVTVLGDRWGLYEASVLSKELASHMAKLPQVEVTYLVPENSCWEKDKRSAALNSVTIVEAKKQPGFDEPTDWLYFPPQDLKTDFVLGVGKLFGKIAQVFKELHRCKDIYIACTPLEQYAVLLEKKRILEKEIERHRYPDKNDGLCQKADLVVAPGPKMHKELYAPLRSHGKDVFKLTPGILSKFSDVKHASSDEQTDFRMLMFGGGDLDTFEEEGLNTALEAVAKLKDKSYRLLYVGAVEGKQEQIAKHICQFGVSKHQVIVRSSPESEEDLKRLFCEADLAIMPSSEQAFGMMALAALSSGLPVLVHEDSGFGEALKEVQFGTQSTVESKGANDWAEAIKRMRKKKRKIRLEEAAYLRSYYNEKYSWEEQCRKLFQRMLTMVTAQPDQSL